MRQKSGSKTGLYRTETTCDRILSIVKASAVVVRQVCFTWIFESILFKQAFDCTDEKFTSIRGKGITGRIRGRAALFRRGTHARYAYCERACLERTRVDCRGLLVESAQRVNTAR